MKLLHLSTLTAGCLLTLTSLGTSAFAGSRTASFTVVATVVKSCSITTPNTGLSFGDYDPTASSATNASTTITITCTQGTVPTIGLNGGNNPGAGSARQLSGPAGALLAYQIYQPQTTAPNAACDYTSNKVWGNSGGDLFNPGQAGNLSARTYNVCGQIAAAKDVPSGSYSDSITATVNF